MSKVPFSYLGLARQLYREVEDIAFARQKLILKVQDKWIDRIERKGTIRNEHFIETVRELKAAYNGFAFDFDCEYRKGYPYIGFYYLTPGKVENSKWDEFESQLNITAVVFEVRKKMAEGDTILSEWCNASLSIHALARWFERNEFKTREVLMSDLKHVGDEAHVIEAGWLAQFTKLSTERNGDPDFFDEFLEHIKPPVEIMCPSGGKFIAQRDIRHSHGHSNRGSFRYAKLDRANFTAEVRVDIRTYYSKVMTGEE